MSEHDAPPPAALPEGAVRIRWPLTPAVELHYCNHFSVAKVGPEFLLQIGQFFASVPGGWTADEFAQFVMAFEVDVKARVILSEKGLRELHKLLGLQLDLIAAAKTAAAESDNA